MFRTHTCGELTKKEEGKEVMLSGWVDSVREHGGIAFINLRDRYGFTQLVFDDPSQIKELKNEYLLKVKGKVRKRPEGIVNKKIVTGEIEVLVSELEILNRCETLPLDLSGQVESTDETRLKYRYLDLRRPENMEKMVLRHKATIAMHEYLDKKGFLYVETPLLIRATPEGARDYVVPSRLHPGKVYSLPQSPQLYKQISMVAGFDKYYQLAKCLRDEANRADRQPEFTQIDIEMSFPEQDDVIELSEGLVKYIFKKCLGKDVKTPFKRMTYQEAMEKYGIDRPDLRFGMELKDVTETVKKSDFKIFQNAEKVKCLVAEKDFSRKEIDKLTEVVKIFKAKGLAHMKYDKGFDKGVSKFLSDEVKQELKKQTGIKDGQTIFFVADKEIIVNDSLAALRNHLGKELELYDPEELNFCWITDFPLFEWDEEANRWSPMHHIFSMPKKEKMKYLEEEPGKVTGYLYDLTLNGTEIGGGSMRIHSREIQEAVLKVIGMDYRQAEERFGFLLEAFKYGAPPHGGIAFGFDRMVAMMAGTNDIREVIAYPKNKAQENPMDQCPSPCEDETAEELHLKFVKPEK